MHINFLFESGSVVNIGPRSCHDQIFLLWPYLVASYVDFQEAYYDTLDIGGADVDNWGQNLSPSYHTA